MNFSLFSLLKHQRITINPKQKYEFVLLHAYCQKDVFLVKGIDNVLNSLQEGLLYNINKRHDSSEVPGYTAKKN